jgi:hypothetical protein
VFNTVAEAVEKAGADTSIIFVPPAFAADAIMEAADAGIKVIITITEGIPTKDMIAVKHYLKDRQGITMIGPNCPGVMTAGECKVGIMPGFIFQKGKIGIVSKSGTLTYEAVDQLTKAGLGQTTAIGIGGDPIIGTTTKQAVELLMNDPETEGITLASTVPLMPSVTLLSLTRGVWPTASIMWLKYMNSGSGNGVGKGAAKVRGLAVPLVGPGGRRTWPGPSNAPNNARPGRPGAAPGTTGVCGRCSAFCYSGRLLAPAPKSPTFAATPPRRAAHPPFISPKNTQE